MLSVLPLQNYPLSNRHQSSSFIQPSQKFNGTLPFLVNFNLPCNNNLIKSVKFHVTCSSSSQYSSSSDQNLYSQEQEQEQEQQNVGFWEKWKAKSGEMSAKLAKLGLAAVLAYGLFDGVTYTTFFVMAFLGYEKSTGNNPAANLKSLIGILIFISSTMGHTIFDLLHWCNERGVLGFPRLLRMNIWLLLGIVMLLGVISLDITPEFQIVLLMWAGNNVTRPFRVAGAAALAPVIDKGLRKIQKALNLPSLVYAFALVAGIVAASCFTVAGLLILSRWGA